MKCLTIHDCNVKIYEQYPLSNRIIPSEKVLFKDVPFEVNDKDLMDYIISQPGMHVKNRNMIHARLRNREGELTSFYSGDRFLYIKGGFRRALPTEINIDHQTCRIQHKSQDLACKRCRYMGHQDQETEKCNAYINNQNMIAIRSPNNALCNYFLCDVNIYGHHFISSEHAYQWKFTSHIGRHDLADEILETSTPAQAKEISSMIPRHMHKDWHSKKLSIMEEILQEKLNSCREFKNALINSEGKSLVESVKNDRFWSCGLTPKEAQTTKPEFYPGSNKFGLILEQLRATLIHITGKSTNSLDKSNHDSSDHSSSSSSSHTSAPISCSDTILHHDIVDIPCPSSDIGVTVALVTESDHVTDKLSSDNYSSIQPNETPEPNPSSQMTKKKLRKDVKSNQNYRNINNTVTEKEQFMMSWLKRKLSPEKEADSMNTSKQIRGDK